MSVVNYYGCITLLFKAVLLFLSHDLNANEFNELYLQHPSQTVYYFKNTTYTAIKVHTNAVAI